MDANKVLDELREVQFQIDSYNDAGEARFMGEWRRMAEGMAGLFAKLDGYLQSGGKPPEEWVEGPDAVGESPAPRDRYAQCTDDCTTDCGACKGAGRPVAGAGNG